MLFKLIKIDSQLSVMRVSTAYRERGGGRGGEERREGMPSGRSRGFGAYHGCV
jgi:hypothetical protein